MKVLSISFIIFSLLCSVSLSKAVALQTVATSQKIETNQTNTDPYRSELFKVDGIADLSVFTTSGDIDLVHNPAIEGVQVDLYVKRGFSLWAGSRSLDNYRIIFRQSGNEITATVEPRARSSRSMGSDDISFYFVIQTPDRVNANLRNMAGNISASGINGIQFLQSQSGNINLKNSTGEISLVATSGHINVKNVEGAVQIRSVSGNVNVNESRGETRIRTVSGNISADEITGAFVGATVSGRINADFHQIAEGVFLESVSGNVNVNVGLNRDLDMSLRALSVNTSGINPELISNRTRQGTTTRFKLGEGGIPVSISTTSGSVIITENEKL